MSGCRCRRWSRRFFSSWKMGRRTTTRSGSTWKRLTTRRFQSRCCGLDTSMPFAVEPVCCAASDVQRMPKPGLVQRSRTTPNRCCCRWLAQGHRARRGQGRVKGGPLAQPRADCVACMTCHVECCSRVPVSRRAMIPGLHAARASRTSTASSCAAARLSLPWLS